MHRPLRAAFAAALLLAASAPPAIAAEDPPPPPAPPAQDRFFPKEMEDALAALALPDPEDAFQQGLATLARMRSREGAVEPMRATAFAPVLEFALATRLEHHASFAGEILVALDAARLAEALSEAADKEQDPRRLFNAAVLLEEVPAGGPAAPPGPDGKERRAPDPVDSLVRVAATGHPAVRIRAAEALGEVCSSRRGPPEKSQERAISTLSSLYSAPGRDEDLKNVCAIALGKTGGRTAISVLMRGLSQTDRKHGFFCAAALSWIEDPAVFEGLQALTAPGGGESLEAHAKAFESCARDRDVEALMGTLTQSGRKEMREAAATALGRILPGFPAPGPEGASQVDPREKERAALRVKASALLLDRMMGDADDGVRWACFHAVSRAGGPWLEEATLKIVRSANADQQARGVHLAGDFKLKSAGKLLFAGLTGAKDDLLRKRCATEFWNCADAESIEELRKRIRSGDGGVVFARAADALGCWRTPEAFDIAMDGLSAARDGSAEQFAVELALEKMTGHFFGPQRGLWTRWREKNPGYFTGKQAKIERERWREEFDKENKGFRQTKETERSVQRGLEWLARHQHPDGRWDPQAFRERCDPAAQCSASMGTRVMEDPVGRTGLVVLAFLGAGYSPEGGKYKTAIRRGMEYLMARQQAIGDYQTHDLIGGYNRPIALQAYAEAYALSRDERLRPYVQKGVDFLTQIQNSIGGWRYRVEVQTSDSSVAAWMLFAMSAAKKSGVPVREVVFEGCRMLFERYSVRVPKNGPREDFVDIDPNYGYEVGTNTDYEFQTGYQDRAYAPTHATTALGLMSHILLGFRRSHPFCIGSANHVLAKQLPQAPKDGNMARLNIRQEYPMYFLYYGTLAMHQMGGRYFRTWNEQLRAILPPTQVKDGCSRGAWIGTALDGVFGSIYVTATGVMTLETYYRYLPVLQD